jgi:hypothetical protein
MPNPVRNPSPDPIRRLRLWWVLVVILLTLGLALAQFSASWAQPHQNELRQTINTPVATPTSGPTSTPSPTAAPGVQRILLQQGLNSYAGTADTYIDAYTPRVAPPLEGGLRIKGGERSALIRFDLQGQLPAGAHIVAAELLFHVDVPPFTVVRALDVSAFRVLRPWQETQVSWNFQHVGDQVRWGQDGCNGVGVDRVGVADDTITLLQRNVYRGFDVIESVRHWQQHPQENFGWLIAGVSASTGSFTLASSRHQVPNQRPMLRIDYTLGDVSPTATPTVTGVPSATPSSTMGGIAVVVFEDVNRNGQRDAGEGGVPGARVQLLDDIQQILDERVTGPEGEVAFNDLTPGWYRVRVHHPFGYRPTTAENLPVHVGSSNIIVPISFGAYRSHAIMLPLIVKPSS